MPNDPALQIWEAMRPKIVALITDQTKDCIRAKRATVVTAPNPATGKIIVQQPFESPISLPYSTAVANVTAGTEVWIIIPHGDGKDLTNAVVVQNGLWNL